MICSAFYEIKAFSPYISPLLNSIRVLNELGIQWDYVIRQGDSYVDRAKNWLLNQFIQSECTHVLMIDSDLAWDTQGFVNILKASLMEAEIVGGAFPNKNNWETYGVIPFFDDDGKPVLPSTTIGDVTLYSTQGIPGGFIIYSRAAIERTRPHLNSYIDEDGNTILQCFKTGEIIETNRTMGEDIFFQNVYRHAGGTVWLEPNIHFHHFGVKGWQGNYKEYMDAEKAKLIDEQNIKELEYYDSQMHV